MSMDPAMSASGGSYAPKGIGDIIKSAFDVYGKHWQRLLVIAAMLIIPVTLVIDLLIYVVIVNAATLTAVAFAGVLASALGVLLFSLVQVAITRGAAASLVGDPSVDDAFSVGLKRLGSYLWIAILIGLITAAPFLVSGLFFLIVPVLGGLLAFVSIFVVIFISTMLAVAIPSLIIENRRGTDALARSWELVKGHFWHAFGAMFVAGLIAFAVSLVIALIFGNTFNWVTNFIGDSLQSIIVLPFTTLVGVVLYIDLRVRVENVTPDQIREQLAASGGK